MVIFAIGSASCRFSRKSGGRKSFGVYGAERFFVSRWHSAYIASQVAQ